MRKQVELAQAFSELLREAIGDRINDVIERNATEENPDACHSHDFCDANEIMLQAWRDCGLSEDAIVGGNPADDAHCLWETAWDIAKEYDFEPDDYAESDFEQAVRERERWL